MDKQEFHLDDWVKEKTSVGEGRVVRVRNNGAGKQLVTYEMPSGHTATQYADFLTLGTPPIETADVAKR